MASSSSDGALREHLVELLDGGHAHAGFDRVVADLPEALRVRRPAGLAHSPWELLEHLRIAQEDIVGFSRGPGWESPAWPDGYWPDGLEPAAGAWEASVAAFRTDLDAMKELVRDPERDLFEPFPWGDGQTLLREAMMLADHNGYHLGQMVDARRLLGAWPAAPRGGGA